MVAPCDQHRMSPQLPSPCKASYSIYEAQNILELSLAVWVEYTLEYTHSKLPAFVLQHVHSGTEEYKPPAAGRPYEPPLNTLLLGQAGAQHMYRPAMRSTSMVNADAKCKPVAACQPHTICTHTCTSSRMVKG